MNPVLELIAQHRTYRHFCRGEMLPESHIQAIIHAAQRAPSWMNGQHYSIINISDAELRDNICAMQPANPHIGECALFLVFVADLHRADLCREAYNGTFQAAGTPDALITAVTDTALAAQNALIAAESLGYATCFVGGIRLSAREMVPLLGLPENTFPLFGLCVGTPDVEMRVKPRLPVAAVYAENRYPGREVQTAKLAEYEQTMLDFGETREKFPYREKFARYYSRPYAPENIALMQSLGWLNRFETDNG